MQAATVVTTDTWTVVSSIAAALSAIFAACAAAVSFVQARDFRRQVQREATAANKVRTFEYSPAASPEFFSARQTLSHSFSGWATGVQITSEQARTAFADRELLDAFNYVLNHRGRMASAYHHRVIDQDLARELFRFAFIRFWNLYEPYIAAEFQYSPALAAQYAHSRGLYEEWYAPELQKRHSPEAESTKPS